MAENNYRAYRARGDEAVEADASRLEQEAEQSALEKLLYGKAGYVAPASPSQWGAGGPHGSLLSLEDYYQGINEGNESRNESLQDHGRPGRPYTTLQTTPEQLAARAEFEAKYPGYYQLSKDQVIFRDGELGLKGPRQGGGYYVERPNEVRYDPEFGYITTVGNDALAGSKGGEGTREIFSAVAPFFAPVAVSALGGGPLGSALYGAGMSAASGGDPLRGAVMGGFSGAMGEIGYTPGEVDPSTWAAEDLASQRVYDGATSLGDIYNPNLATTLGNEWQELKTNPTVVGAKDIYNTYKKVTGAANTLQGIFGSGGGGPTGYMNSVSKAQTPGATTEELSQLYNSNFGNQGGYWDQGYKNRVARQPAFGRR